MPKKSAFSLNNRKYQAPTPNAGKIVTCVLVGIAAELILTIIGKYYGRAGSFGFMYGAMLVLAVLTGGAAVYFGVLLAKASKKSHKDVPLFAALTAGAAAACLSFVVLRLWWVDGLRLLYVLWAGIAVLGVLSQIYYPEFIYLAGLSGLGAVGAFASYRSMAYSVVSSATITITAVVVIGAVLVTVLTAAAGRNDGGVPLLGCTLRVYTIAGSKVLLYVTALVAALCAVLALFLGAAFCYYCFFVAVAWLLLSAAYYTIRLM